MIAHQKKTITVGILALILLLTSFGLQQIAPTTAATTPAATTPAATAPAATAPAAKTLTNHVITFLTNYGVTISLTILSPFFLWLLFEAFKRYVWEEKVKRFLDTEKEKMASSIESIRTSTETLLNDHIEESKKFHEENRLKTAIAQSNPKELITSMQDIHRSAYGNHCNSEKSLYASVGRLVAKYFKADVPHRSNHNQDITIEECGNHVKWIEDTSYELHTVAIDDDFKTPHDTKEVSHDLTYSTTASYVELKDLVLIVHVDDEELFTTVDNLLIEQDADNKVTSVQHKSSESVTFKYDEDSEEWHLSISINIQITSPKVCIRIHEESQLQEDFMVVARDVPTCSSTLSITLPTSWEFVHFTIPPNQGWCTVNSLKYKRKAYTTGWVLPGITLSCSWRRT